MTKKNDRYKYRSKGENENENSGSGDFIVQNTELHLAHSLQNFLVYYTGRIGKLQCILFLRKMQQNTVFIGQSA